MDVEQRSDGHLHFALGPVERWIVAIGACGIVGMVGWMWQSTATRLDDQGKTLFTVVTQQAVTNAQLQNLSSQLADVPGLTRQMAQLQVQVQRNTADVHDLQQGADNPKLRGWTK